MQRYGRTSPHPGEGSGGKGTPVRKSTGAPRPYPQREDRQAYHLGLPHSSIFGGVLQCTQFHVPSRQDSGGREAVEGAGIAAEGGENLASRQGFHDVLLADPLEAAGAAKSVEKARNLMFDAVHMKPAGFAALAGKIRDLIQQWMLSRKRKGGSIAQPDGKRARTDQAAGGGSGPSGLQVRRSGAKGGKAAKSGSGAGTGKKK